MFSKTSTGFETSILVSPSDRKRVAKSATHGTRRGKTGAEGRNNPAGQSPLHVTLEYAQSTGAHGRSLRPAPLEGHCLGRCAL